MSRTAKRNALVTMTAAALLSANPAVGQTLSDLAGAQRAKQQAEIIKLHKEAAADLAASTPIIVQADPVATKADVRRNAEAQRPRVVLHSLYARNGVWIAELAEGQRLALALPGMQLYGHRIMGIDQRGVTVVKACSASDVRDKVSCGQRIVPVGGAI